MKKFDYANIDFLSNEDMKNLEEIAKACENFEEFAGNVGWADWMQDFTSAEDGEEIPEADTAIIDEVLKKVFNAVKGN